MAVERQNWVPTTLNVLEKLYDEHAAIVRTHHQGRKVRRHVERLVRDALVRVEKAVLVAAEVVLLNEWM